MTRMKRIALMAGGSYNADDWEPSIGTVLSQISSMGIAGATGLLLSKGLNR